MDKVSYLLHDNITNRFVLRKFRQFKHLSAKLCCGTRENVDSKRFLHDNIVSKRVAHKTFLITYC